MASKAKDLRRSKGIMSVPYQKKTSNSIELGVSQLIDCFYVDDEISSVMPGKNDYVSMLVNGKSEYFKDEINMKVTFTL